MPGFIGPLAYTEDIPDNLMMSKHLEVVKEKLLSLWEKQHGMVYQHGISTWYINSQYHLFKIFKEQHVTIYNHFMIIIKLE